jgi:16S rRNA (guanine527-N7)-methyltransferase
VKLSAPPADVVDALFPERQEAIHRYVDLLINVGVDRGLIGPREVPRLWERHVVNCAVLRGLFAPGSTVADIGSGAGLPGIVLALSRPDLEVTLIEPLLRRSRFLEEAVDALGLEQVEVVRARAEDLIGQRTYDTVTARAVAPLARLIPWGLPLCRAGGELIAMKGATAEQELAEARQSLALCQAGDVHIEQLGAGLATTLTTVVRIGSNGHIPGKGKGGR